MTKSWSPHAQLSWLTAAARLHRFTDTLGEPVYKAPMSNAEKEAKERAKQLKKNAAKEKAKKEAAEAAAAAEENKQETPAEKKKRIQREEAVKQMMFDLDQQSGSATFLRIWRRLAVRASREYGPVCAPTTHLAHQISDVLVMFTYIVYLIFVYPGRLPIYGGLGCTDDAAAARRLGEADTGAADAGAASTGTAGTGTAVAGAAGAGAADAGAAGTSLAEELATGECSLLAPVRLPLPRIERGICLRKPVASWQARPWFPFTAVVFGLLAVLGNMTNLMSLLLIRLNLAMKGVKSPALIPIAKMSTYTLYIGVWISFQSTISGITRMVATIDRVQADIGVDVVTSIFSIISLVTTFLLTPLQLSQIIQSYVILYRGLLPIVSINQVPCAPRPLHAA